MINTENTNLRTNNDQKIPDQNMNMNVIQFKMVNMQKTIPLDVSKELAGYKTLYIVNQYDPFRIFHYCCDPYKNDFIVYGLLPDGDKKVLFTVRMHYQCCEKRDNIIIHCCCCDYVVYDRILIQFDYKRNGENFYTQGLNSQKGCYCCKCQGCNCCCPYNKLQLNCDRITLLFLRENTEPDNPDFNVGIFRGRTEGVEPCLSCYDKTVTYYDNNGVKGYTLRKRFCDPCCCPNIKDIDLYIEDSSGQQVGNVYLPRGCCSRAIESCCYRPPKYAEINFPLNSTSMEKFHLISQVIHYLTLIPKN